MSNDSAGVEVGNSAAAELHRAHSSSFLTASVEKVFFRSVLMMKPHRACTHDRQSFVSPRLYLSLSLCTISCWWFFGTKPLSL